MTRKLGHICSAEQCHRFTYRQMMFVGWYVTLVWSNLLILFRIATTGLDFPAVEINHNMAVEKKSICFGLMSEKHHEITFQMPRYQFTLSSILLKCS